MKDNFEDFIKKETCKSNIEIPDNGFSEKVTSSLPKRKTEFIGRKIIIIFSTIISVLVFILINGSKIFLTGITDLFYSLINSETPNYEFIVVLIVFSIMSLIIPYIEIKEWIF
ncbi:MAG: hypothetical protein A2W99_15590 [Bacteroidetes bacterium GWF2_33_16]|nr:MAG: hypothetical protein A2X00_14935 [Bacteroidetes bacterium GWE2_32_14]OFY02332.1 MAG: hypothetical protein A2W99_15590 [Bacteroidetes bacterium GWF2_33_16]